MEHLKNNLVELSKNIGFDLIGFSDAKVDEDIKQAYQSWLENGYSGNMDYMAKTENIRKNPQELLPGAQTVVSVALSYLQGKESVVPQKGHGLIARYARSRDYHKIFRKKMKIFCEEAQKIFVQHGHNDAKIIYACDTKPVLEKYFAWKAGLGFIGRNTCLITKKHGSFVFLGTFLSNVFVDRDEPDKRTCGLCRDCIDACPTKALVADKVLDATKCTSYWTIEYKGEFPDYAKKYVGDYLFGCDICQEVCPWNKRALTVNNIEFQQKVPAHLEINTILKIKNKDEFLEKFAGTPLMRAGFEGMKRNAMAVMENQKKL